MKVNPNIKSTLKEISDQSVSLANNPDKHFKYMRRIIRVFEEHLTLEEKAYLVSTMIENIHYKNALLDPDNMLQASNIRHRTILFVVMMVVLVIVVAGIVFKTNDSLNEIVDYFNLISKTIAMTKGN